MRHGTQLKNDNPDKKLPTIFNKQTAVKDIEQLKLILEQIGQTTESAKWVAILWMSLDVLKTAIMWIGGLFLAKIFTSFVRRIWITLNQSDKFERSCRDMVIPRQAGTIVTDKERQQVLKFIEKSLIEEKSKS